MKGQKIKRTLSIMLSLVMMLTSATPAFASTESIAEPVQVVAADAANMAAATISDASVIAEPVVQEQIPEQEQQEQEQWQQEQQGQQEYQEPTQEPVQEQVPVQETEPLPEQQEEFEQEYSQDAQTTQPEFTFQEEVPETESLPQQAQTTIIGQDGQIVAQDTMSVAEPVSVTDATQKTFEQMTDEERIAAYYAMVEAHEGGDLPHIDDMTEDQKKLVDWFTANAERFVNSGINAAAGEVSVKSGAIMYYRYGSNADGTYEKYINDSSKRAIYCVEHNKHFTDSAKYSTENHGAYNEWRSAITYALTNGPQTHGGKSTSDYTTGSSVGDYFATQLAVWGLEEKLLGIGIDINTVRITSFKNGSASSSKVITKATTLYKDALAFAESAKNDKNNVGYGKNISYSFSENSVSIEKGSDGNYYSQWINIKASSELKQSDLTVSPSGKATVEKNGNKFRIKVTSANATDGLRITVSGNAHFEREIAYDHTVVSIPGGGNLSTQQRVIWLTTETQTIDKADSVVGIVEVVAKPLFYLYKKSTNEAMTLGKKEYSLVGARYGIYADSACTIQLDDTVIKEDNLDGTAKSTTVKGLEPGKYYVKEITPPKCGNYEKDETVYNFTLTAAHISGNPCTITVRDKPKTASLGLLKVSECPEVTIENRNYSVKGAQYNVYSDSELTKKVGTLTVGEENAKGEARSNILTGLSIGKYYLKEVPASVPKGYVLDTEKYTVTLNSKHTESNPYIARVKETPLLDPFRLVIRKKNSVTGEQLKVGGAIFEIKFYDDMKFDPSADNADSVKPLRTWFIQTNEDSYASLTDPYKVDFNGIKSDDLYLNDEEGGRSTLPLGTIVVREVKAPAGYTLEGATYQSETGQTFDGYYVDHITEVETGATYATLKMGNNIVELEKPITISTVGFDEETNSQYSGSINERAIADRVKVENLESDVNYILKAQLVDKTSNKVIAEGTSEVFTSAGEVTEKTVSLGSINLAAYAGKDLVIYESLYLAKDGQPDGDPIAEHKEKEDKDQTIYVPKIGTVATAAEDDSHVVDAAENVSIKDVVSYSNLNPEGEYIFRGQVYDKETGKPFIDAAGKTVEAESTLEAGHDATGTDTITFTFNAKGMEGKKLVVYERCYAVLNEETESLIAVHEDINDENQTISIPKVSTAAKDSITETDHALVSDTNTIIDEVSFENVEPGKTYKATGGVINAETGETIESKVIAAVAGEGASDVVMTDEGCTFKATADKGAVYLTFRFDGHVLDGAAGVIYEDLFHEERHIATHHDITSEPQTVYVPKIRTEAIAQDTGDKTTGNNDQTIIVDTVYYHGLKPGATYRMRGELIVKEGVATTGTDSSAEPVEEETTTSNGYTKASSVIVDESGKEIDYVEFVPEEKEGTVKVNFRVNGKNMDGLSYVAFEQAWLVVEGGEEKLVATHEDPNDEAQSVHVPRVNTNATDKNNGTNHVPSNKKSIVADEVHYFNLVPGYSYEVKGTLHDQKTGEVIASEMVSKDGKVIDSYKFTVPKDAKTNEYGGVDGSVVIYLQFDSSAIEGTTAVVFEDLLHNGKNVAAHHDLTDYPQTVFIPKVRTNAVGEETNQHIIYATEGVIVKDTVSYSGLEAGKTYRLKGKLVNKEKGAKTSSEMVAKKGEAYEKVNYVEFTPEGKAGALVSGKVDVFFRIDASKLAGQSIVAYEYLYLMNDKKEVEVAKHEDLKDAAQTVHIPSIATSASAADTGTKETQKSNTTTIVDKVTFKNLVPNLKYRMTGTLHSKVSGKAFKKANGEDFTFSGEFTPAKSSGSVSLKCTVNTSQLAGQGVVVYEKCELVDGEKASVVAVHEDQHDENQTVTIVELKTNASDKTTGTQEMAAAKEAKIVDKVTYKGLTPGKKYTVKGILMDKSTQKPLTVNGNTVTQTKEFTPNAVDGAVELTFTFDASALAGKTVVVYEDLYRDNKKIAVHNEINDPDQSVNVLSIKTVLTDKATGKKEVTVGKNVVLVDTVTYNGLTKGKKYTLKGWLVDKETGNAVGIPSEVTFEAGASEGTQTVEFVVDTSSYKGKHIVAFEELYNEKSVLIASHKDTSDPDQTVTVPGDKTTPTPTPPTTTPTPPPTTVKNVKTGDTQLPLVHLALTLTALAAIAFVYRRRRLV